MEAIIVTGLQYLIAAVLGIFGLKGGEAVYKKYKVQEESSPVVSTALCDLKHQGLDLRLAEIKKDVSDIKQALSKLIDLQVELVSLRGDLNESIHMETDKHEARYHKVP